ncbi:MAG: glycosyltransferase [Lachnospiraceae bacterium]|nr:glycosyltransferase [Lachnospiraceae bacterium]
MDLDVFLQNIVSFINEVRGENRQDVLRQLVEEIVIYQVQAKEHGDFYSSLEEALSEDIELYYLVLFTIQFISQDKECISIMDKLLMRSDLDVFVAGNICFQLASIRFRDFSLKRSYAQGREINQFLLDKYEKEYPLPVPYLPYEERNKKRIAIETDTLLRLEHAPTRIVLDACQVLQKDLGYEVLLIVNALGMKEERMKQFCAFPYIPHRLPALDGAFSLEYEGTVIQGYQLPWEPGAIGEMQQSIMELYDWKPLCVWHIGGGSFRHDILRNFTTVLSMPCVDGYSVSEAQVLVSYMQSNSQSVKEAVEYAEQHGQKCLNIESKTQRGEMGTGRKRSDFQLPEDAFVITIVGNRLDDEMSKEFNQMLLELEQQIDDIYFLIIGPCKRKPLQTRDKNKVKYVGFCKDLVDVVKLADLFVNPPRQGGGGGAVCALISDVPIVTLPDCDVFNMIGEEFSCRDMTEMKEVIIRYTQDDDFYKSQQTKERQKKEEREQIDNKTSYREMLQTVETWLQKGEIT